ncbi:hypothetical protein LKL35_05605 [Streptomyces sp. ET3-23]|uniref:hypothetical protein n=1 Tax=Streptomyces sp. ET3-23 TaxID=2885643 RepID=UPI001D0F75BF|nr:hypothetical protein [Streptomyces sp. ET3-23]MCC2274912.1 hypothetical protein [Streptomyces sp. ET3-23]
MTSKFEWFVQDRVQTEGSQAIFQLKHGATGFRDSSTPPLPETDPTVCRTAWHAAARTARGHVQGLAERQYPQNFHTGTINDRDGTHVALFHAHYPLIAFVGDRRHCYTDEFQDPPTWAVTLNDFGFAVLTASLLLLPPERAEATALSAVEWKQIKRWQPETLGAMLFNSWD